MGFYTKSTDVSISFAWCPPDSFWMGSKNGYSDETPVHKVTLTKGFLWAFTPSHRHSG